MYKLPTDDLVHAQTLSEGRITRPFRVGLRNSGVALAALAVGVLVHLCRVAGTLEFTTWWEITAWWAWGAVAAGAVAVCFGHAYLGAKVGGRRANDVGLLFLFVCLVALILWMKRTIDAGR